jgi:hypothetical protein
VKEGERGVDGESVKGRERERERERERVSITFSIFINLGEKGNSDRQRERPIVNKFRKIIFCLFNDSPHFPHAE